jgi:hypothetical protein
MMTRPMAPLPAHPRRWRRPSCGSGRRMGAPITAGNQKGVSGAVNEYQTAILTFSYQGISCPAMRYKTSCSSVVLVLMRCVLAARK